MLDAAIIKSATDFRRGLLGENASGAGMCAYASISFCGYLRAILGQTCDVVYSDVSEHDMSDFEQHYWIKMPDGRALDLTLDQFGEIPSGQVYLGHPTEFHQAPFIYP